MRILFIDTETTGLNSQKNDIIQIAGQVVEDGLVLESFNFKCQPVNWDTISPQALQVTNTTIAQLRTYENPKDTFAKFLAVLVKYATPKDKFLIAGQNVKKFDWRFIVSFWEKHKGPEDKDFQFYFDNRTSLDLMDLTKPMKVNGILEVENIKLGTIVEALNIPIEGNLHDALTDITVTRKSFYKMLDEYKNLYQKMPKHKIFSDVNVDYILRLFNIIE